MPRSTNTKDPLLSNVRAAQGRVNAALALAEACGRLKGVRLEDGRLVIELADKARG